MPAANSLGDLEVWFLTGSQHLYGEETLLQVAAQSGRVAAVLDAAGEVPVRVVWKPVLTDPDDGTELLIIDEATTCATWNSASPPTPPTTASPAASNGTAPDGT